MPRAIHKVYKITFGNGSVYVGYTSQKLSLRIYQHKHGKQMNKRLSAALQFEVFEAAEVSRHRTKDRAIEHEKKLFNKLVKDGVDVLNVFEPGQEVHGLARRRKADYIACSIGKDVAKCSQCRRTLNRDCFSSDRSRSSGLNSRCKDCGRLITRSINSQRMSYHDCLKVIHDWRDNGYIGDHPGIPHPRDKESNHVR